MSKHIPFHEMRKLLMRKVLVECELYHDANESGLDKLKLRDKKTKKIYEFPKLDPRAQDWRNDPANRKLFKAMHSPPHIKGEHSFDPDDKVPGVTGWINYANANTSPCHRFSATQSVPSVPSTGGASLVSYWLGLLLGGGYNYLMQPVLVTGSGASVWSAQDWVVDMSGSTIAVGATSPTVSPGGGATVSPFIVWDGTGWTIVMTGLTSGIYLTGVNGAGAGPLLVKEVHNYNVCSDINCATGCGFSGMVIGDGSGFNVTGSAVWGAYPPSTPCFESVNLTFANSTGAIFLNL